MVTQENQQVVKVEKRQSVGDLLKEKPFYPELKMADKDAPLAGPIVIYDCQVREWDSDEYGHKEYVVFKWAPQNTDGSPGEPQLGKTGGIVIVSKFKRLLRLRYLPNPAGLDAVILFNVSETTGRTYFDFAPF